MLSYWIGGVSSISYQCGFDVFQIFGFVGIMVIYASKHVLMNVNRFTRENHIYVSLPRDVLHMSM